MTDKNNTKPIRLRLYLHLLSGKGILAHIYELCITYSDYFTKKRQNATAVYNSINCFSDFTKAATLKVEK